jgi:hypothetical protein
MAIKLGCESDSVHTLRTMLLNVMGKSK